LQVQLPVMIPWFKTQAASSSRLTFTVAERPGIGEIASAPGLRELSLNGENLTTVQSLTGNPTNS
jgi:hypothetical protein